MFNTLWSITTKILLEKQKFGELPNHVLLHQERTCSLSKFHGFFISDKVLL